MNKTIIVKIGTESLRNFDSEKVEKMIRDISALMQEKIRVILVSSGAVGCGREVLQSETNKQVLASVGQPILMSRYAEKFSKYGITTAQVLPTHATLELHSHREQFRTTVQAIMDIWILPIINENDSLSTVEMRALWKWADNDQNALLVAHIIWACDIILITNTNGIYRDRADNGTRISKIKAHKISDEWIQKICGEKSESGTGGMESKLRIGKRFAKIGGITHICDGIHSGVFEHIKEENTDAWTRIMS